MLSNSQRLGTAHIVRRRHHDNERNGVSFRRGPGVNPMTLKGPQRVLKGDKGLEDEKERSPPLLSSLRKQNVAVTFAATHGDEEKHDPEMNGAKADGCSCFF